jgi:hypothetical protein
MTLDAKENRGADEHHADNHRQDKRDNTANYFSRL